MFFTFKTWHYLIKPHHLAEQLKSSSMRGLKGRVILVFIVGILLFAIRELWGMNTEAITPVLSTMTTTDYTIARYASLLGTFLWAMIYMFFHFFGLSFILMQVTGIPFKKLLPLQLLTIVLLLIEKALLFAAFATTGVGANVSFLSLGPLAATFFEIPFFIFFYNQLTLTTVAIIVLQYKFILTYTELAERKRLLGILIGIHLLMAIATAAFGFISLESLFEFLTGGLGK